MNLRQLRSRVAHHAAYFVRTPCALALLCASGCTEPDFVEDSGDAQESRGDGEPGATLDASVVAARPALDAGAAAADRWSSPSARTITRPDGAYAADIVADGTGCLGGSWDARFAYDGKDLEFNTGSMSLDVHATQKINVKDCRLRVRLRSPKPIRFAVRSLRFRGYAFLEQGVKLRLTSQHYFQGQSVPPPAQSEVIGPYDDMVPPTHAGEQTELLWTGCATTHELNVNLLARLQNATPPRTGYAFVSGLDGSTKPPTQIALEQQACTP